MSKNKWTNRVMDIAFIRDGDITYTDEAVILACLVHTQGKKRAGQDMQILREIMQDPNLDK